MSFDAGMLEIGTHVETPGRGGYDGVLPIP